MVVYKAGDRWIEMRVMITGANGQLGRDITHHFSKTCEVIGFGREDWDITDEKKSEEILLQYKPAVLIHCAAYTNVDLSEDYPDIAYKVNVHATRVLANLCNNTGIRFVYISTDYVFDGSSPLGYTEQDFPHPINVYGKSKRLGEKWTTRCCPNHLIIRTSWLYGKHGKNFVKSILHKARLHEELSVVHDQVGSPTSTMSLARHLLLLLQKEATGIFHLSNTGSCSWFEFAKKILEFSNIQCCVQSITSSRLSRKATRPTCSILCSTQLTTIGLERMPHWEEALYEYMRGD